MAIFICGFMGCGKSTFLKELERNSSKGELIDLDDLIYETYKEDDESLGHLIEREGFAQFRIYEAQLIRILMKRGNDTVVALGGGAMGQISASQFLENNCPLVFLDIDFETCWRRVISDATRRPLVLEGKKSNKKRFEMRRCEYQKSALTLKGVLPSSIEELQRKLLQ